MADQDYGLWGVLADYGGYGPKSQEAESGTLRNLYAQGYQGADISGGVREGRSPIGQLLQKVGILGEPDPRPATPYEKYVYSQGDTARVKESMGLESARFNIDNAKRSRQLSDLSALLNAEKLGAGAPPSIFGEMPEDQLLSGAAVGQQAAEERKLELERAQAVLENVRAQTEYYKTGGKKGKEKGPADVAKLIKNVKANNKELVEEIQTLTLGSRKGLGAKGLHELKGKEKEARLEQLKILRQRLELAIADQGVDLDEVKRMADAVAGREPGNALEEVVGLRGPGGGESNITDIVGRVGKSRQLDEMVGQPSMGSIFLEMLLEDPSTYLAK